MFFCKKRIVIQLISLFLHIFLYNVKTNNCMNFLLVSISDPQLEDILAQVVSEDFSLSIGCAKSLVGQRVMQHLKRFRTDTKIVIERNYVDKVYRDSYYTYYASKRTHYEKDVVKLSFFSDSEDFITKESFSDKESLPFLKDCYRGFIVLRPTSPYIVGRSAIVPDLLENHSFKTCLAYISSSAAGLKVTAQAFPFSSQDTETISCAETMVWALMEYYGNKYPEYSPVLPSKILNVLKQNMVERQLPSSGLSVGSMSYLLKECGFGPKLYSCGEFKDDFSSLLSCYIESGIPIIVALDNTDAVKNEDDIIERTIGHAVLCIGHELVDGNLINGVPVDEYSFKGREGTLKIKDWDKISKKFIFIDDNFPVYQAESLEDPIRRYLEIPEEKYPNKEAKERADKEWGSCKISHFIVPLHKKTYLEAYVAKKFVRELLISDFFKYEDGKELYMRTFLCSARSYREYVSFGNMPSNMKGLIMSKSFPKFVWVTEISGKSIPDGKANGVILLDATEANVFDFRPLILAVCGGYVVQYDKNEKSVKSSPMVGGYFDIYDNNLKKL